MLTAINITVDTNGTTVFFTRSNVSELSESELFSEEIRVYVLNMYPTHARRIMCKVWLALLLAVEPVEKIHMRYNGTYSYI